MGWAIARPIRVTSTQECSECGGEIGALHIGSTEKATRAVGHGAATLRMRW